MRRPCRRLGGSLNRTRGGAGSGRGRRGCWCSGTLSRPRGGPVQGLRGCSGRSAARACCSPLDRRGIDGVRRGLAVSSGPHPRGARVGGAAHDRRRLVGCSRLADRRRGWVEIAWVEGGCRPGRADRGWFVYRMSVDGTRGGFADHGNGLGNRLTRGARARGSALARRDFGGRPSRLVAAGGCLGAASTGRGGGAGSGLRRRGRRGSGTLGRPGGGHIRGLGRCRGHSGVRA